MVISGRSNNSRDRNNKGSVSHSHSNGSSESQLIHLHPQSPDVPHHIQQGGGGGGGRRPPAVVDGDPSHHHHGASSPSFVVEKVRKSIHSSFSSFPPKTKMPAGSSSNDNNTSSSFGIDSLGSKLNSLSIQERSEGLHDLHGVADIEDETPEMLRAKVEELTRALDLSNAKIAADLRIDDDPTAFRTAMSLDPSYVERLKVPCLRSDRYVVKDAAARMIRFFARKQQLFGSQPLVKDIEMPDLSVDDMHALQNGLIQLLPQRDRSGRAILILFGKLSPQYTTETVLRVLFYLSMVALQDEESQRRGFVLVYYGIGQKKVVRGRALEMLKSWWATPMRIVAGHFCSESNVMHPAVRLMFYAMELSLLCRFRCHFGTNMECTYDLMTFGIPKEVLPIAADGTVLLESQHGLLAALKRREEQRQEEEEEEDDDDEEEEEDNGHDDELLKFQQLLEPTTIFDNDDTGGIPQQSSTSSSVMMDATPTTPQPTQISRKNNKNKNTTTTTTTNKTKKKKKSILIPGPMDLVMGRGRHAKNAPGALRMRHLLEEYRHEYDAASKYEKTIVAELVLSKMKNSGCRFLKTAPDGWVECDDSIARSRLAHAFRNLRKGGGGCSNTGGGATTTSSSSSGGGGSVGGKQGEKRNLED